MQAALMATTMTLIVMAWRLTFELEIFAEQVNVGR